MLASLLLLWLTGVGAAPLAGADVIRSRLANAPNDCGLLLSPVDAHGNHTLNNSSTLREAVLEELLRTAHATCLRYLAQNMALHEADGELATRQHERILDHLVSSSPQVLEVPEIFCGPSSSPLTPVLQLAAQTKRLTNCRAAAPGDYVVVDATPGPTGLAIQYALAQSSSRRWHAILAVDVEGAHGISGADLLLRIRSCLSVVTPYLRGPAGEELEISVLTPAEAQALPPQRRPPVVQLAVQPAGARSNSKAYAADIDCATILHEVLHLLGLCDEYDGSADGFQCRSVNPGRSIMSSHTALFRQTVPYTMTCECVSDDCHRLLRAGDPLRIEAFALAWEIDPADYAFRNKYCQTPKMLAPVPLRSTKINEAALHGARGLRILTHEVSRGAPDRVFPISITCECPPDDAACMRLRQEIIEQLPRNGPTQCPSGSREKQVHYGTNPQGPRIGDHAFQLSSRPQGTGLLHPTHFSRIVGGACPDVTSQYNECAKWAYRGTWDKSDCASVPPFCQELWR